MQKIFKEVKSLDTRCCDELFLSEDILMENASNALANEVRLDAKKSDKILFICGSGNNGADGIAAARLLTNELNVYVYMPVGVKSKAAKLQLKRLKALNVNVVTSVIDADIYIDAIFGSGLRSDLSEGISSLVRYVNEKSAKKIACDIPTGIDSCGNVKQVSFKADVTITMGALKESLYSDIAKEYVGKIKVANLGISRESYEAKHSSYLLQKNDLVLPKRDKKSVHKGDFGHVVVIGGDKSGASHLSSISAFNFGAGIVTLVRKNGSTTPYCIISSEELPKKFSVIVAGMGLGDMYSDDKLRNFLLFHEAPLVVDAELLSNKIVKEILEKKDEVVLTPHPKEFAGLLNILNIANINTREIQSDRFRWARKFASKYPKAILVLKGANTIIVKGDALYVNPTGNSKLAKGGSGDVLAGMIGSLIAQNYSPLSASLNASLAHAKIAKKSKCSSFGLTPEDLCEGIKWL